MKYSKLNDYKIKIKMFSFRINGKSDGYATQS